MGAVCGVDGCDRSVTPGGGRGLCQIHYMRLRRTGTTDTNPEPHRRRNPEVCQLEGCDRKTVAFGLCDTHYRAARRVTTVRGPRFCCECLSEIPEHLGGRAVYCPRCSKLARRLRPYKGFRPRDYLAMYEAQRGRCLVCDRFFEELDVEHCHRTSRIRGLMCGRCNTAMGLLCDDPALLRRAADFLDSLSRSGG